MKESRWGKSRKETKDMEEFNSSLSKHTTNSWQAKKKKKLGSERETEAGRLVRKKEIAGSQGPQLPEVMATASIAGAAQPETVGKREEGK